MRRNITYRALLMSGVFKSTWKTDNVGVSNDNQITLPLEATGTYDFEIDWGDGNKDTITTYDQAEVTHTYSSIGTYTVKISGAINGWRFNDGGDKLKLLTIESWGDLILGNSSNYFYGCANLVINAIDVLDLSSVQTLNYAFANCPSIVNIDVSKWDVSNVSNFRYTFYNCQSLTSLDTSNWDVSSVVYFYSTFRNCYVLISLDVSSWDVSNVTTFEDVFMNCYILTSLDVSNWDVSSVTIFENAFYGCSDITTLDVSLWNVSSVANFTRVFYNCTSLATLNVSSWNIGNVTTFNGAFYNCAFTSIAVDNWNITNVSVMTNMFYGVTLTTVNYDAILIAWEAQAVQNNVTFSGGNSKYTGGGVVATARQALIDDHTWIITDGGIA